MATLATWLFSAMTALLFLWLNEREKRRVANPQGLPLPPGPKPLPIIGNVIDMPRGYEWLTYSEWAKQFGAAQILPLVLRTAAEIVD